MAPGRDQLDVFDSGFKKHHVRPIADLGLPTQLTSAGSANAGTSDCGIVTEVDLVNQTARESEPLISVDRRAVSVTTHVVTQPRSGAESVRVRTFSFEDPRVDAEGERFAKLGQLMRRGSSEGAHAIPMSVFPFR